MRIHKEGYVSILIATLVVSLSLFIYFLFTSILFTLLHLFVSLVGIGILFFVIRFFRVPSRVINKLENGVISPADGTIVAIEEFFESEFFKDLRMKISIFMSANNVHVNSYPIDGVVEYVAYHPGKYLIAKLPKSSIDNEHNSIVVRKNEREVVLFRQIAGIVARRIVCYAKPGAIAEQGEEMGIIRFGSRVDVFLPLDAQIAVKLGDKVTSKKTVLAYF
jgi:phosphatidylserine decarboxylase